GLLAVPIISTAEQSIWTIAWWSMAAIYGASAALSARPYWLYPALGSALVAYLATVYVLDPQILVVQAIGSLVVPGVLLFAGAHLVGGGRPDLRAFGAPLYVHALADSWSTPLLLTGSVVVGVSAIGTVVDPSIGLRTALI